MGGLWVKEIRVGGWRLSEKLAGLGCLLGLQVEVINRQNTVRLGVRKKLSHQQIASI